MPTQDAIAISGLAHHYGEHEAISDLSLNVMEREIFALLGPNGSGKTTLFRLLSTLIPLQRGEVTILGDDLRRQPDAIRARMGVVFQAPSLDKKLTVVENLTHMGRLYGLGGGRLRARIAEMLARFRLTDRRKSLVETLSGGLRRRVELAQGMLHEPRLLILDEPSTGLDPGARSDLWQYLQQVRDSDGVTVLLTTHLLEEAGLADRIGIMHGGRLSALDTPVALRASIGGDAITIHTKDPKRLAADIQGRFECSVMVVDGAVRLERPDGHLWVSRLVEALGPQIDSITLGKPTLEDVFIHATGHQFWADGSGSRGRAS